MIGSASKAKYIVIDNYLPVVFGSMLKHSDVARDIGGEVTGAGFVSFVERHGRVIVVTSGESLSLGIRPSPTDEMVIACNFGINTEEDTG